MKYTSYILAFSFLLIQACTDPIDVELADADTQIVVDAWLDNQSNKQVIKLSTTGFYFDSSATPTISGATVSVTSSSGQVFDFLDVGNGNYEWTPLAGEVLGQVGDSFDLLIINGDEQYTASTEMFRVPEIDSITQEFVDDEIFLDDGIYTEFFSRDLEGLGDTYWIKSYKDGLYLNKPEEINIAYDAGFDSGGEVDGLIFIPPIRDLSNEVGDLAQIPWNLGETLRVEIHSISNEAFAFMEIMRDQLLNGLNGIFAEPLANTRGNIQSTGELSVLGMFNVAAISSMEYTIN